jgi:hypothetical protein
MGSRGGIDCVPVEEFGRHLERNIKGLQQQIIRGSYLSINSLGRFFDWYHDLLFYELQINW